MDPEKQLAKFQVTYLSKAKLGRRVTRNNNTGTIRANKSEEKLRKRRGNIESRRPLPQNPSAFKVNEKPQEPRKLYIFCI
ncbi:hypothetical protein JTB14_001213 [Gonioctena quinquepunctata]|nr:hypothetical protein JTB14_001213 [Gonioctena quinquepunctata]